MSRKKFHIIKIVYHIMEVWVGRMKMPGVHSLRLFQITKRFGLTEPPSFDRNETTRE
jgi:hypothetical protein